MKKNCYNPKYPRIKLWKSQIKCKRDGSCEWYLKNKEEKSKTHESFASISNGSIPKFQNIDRETKKKSKPNIRAEKTNLGFGVFWVKKWWWASFAPSDVYNWLFPCTINYVQVWILGEERM